MLLTLLGSQQQTFSRSFVFRITVVQRRTQDKEQELENRTQSSGADDSQWEQQRKRTSERENVEDAHCVLTALHCGTAGTKWVSVLSYSLKDSR